MSAIVERFVKKVVKTSHGCHEWQSTLHRDGYGKFWLDGGQIAAHRAAYLLFVGEIPKDLFVLHKCDNRRCVNPEHLYAGSSKQNAADRTERLRWTHERLTTEEVAEIRRRYALGGETQQQLADVFNCDQTQISKIVRLVQRTAK